MMMRPKVFKIRSHFYFFYFEHLGRNPFYYMNSFTVHKIIMARHEGGLHCFFRVPFTRFNLCYGFFNF